MRFLLISDTHGKLEVINELAASAQADAVIHAGDFGFYDDGSYERLSDRELRLHITHTDLPPLEKGRILALPRDERTQAARENCPLSEFPSYITGERRFNVPVYAVWGNHEDKHVVDMVFNGDIQMDNLHVLTGRNVHRVGPALVYGLGGNFLPGSKLLQSPIAGEPAGSGARCPSTPTWSKPPNKKTHPVPVSSSLTSVRAKNRLWSLSQPGQGRISRSAGTWGRRLAWSGTPSRSAQPKRPRTVFKKASRTCGRHAWMRPKSTRRGSSRHFQISAGSRKKPRTLEEVERSPGGSAA